MLLVLGTRTLSGISTTQNGPVNTLRKKAAEKDRDV